MGEKEIFIQAIREKKIVKVKVNSDEKGIIVRHCVPFDFGPGKLPGIRYHTHTLDSPEGPHNLSILPDQLLEIEITNKEFNPADYIKWQGPYKWHIQRDWGEYS